MRQDFYSSRMQEENKTEKSCSVGYARHEPALSPSLESTGWVTIETQQTNKIMMQKYK